MIKLSAEVVPNPHAAGFICSVELREYGKNNKRELSTVATAKPTSREAWQDCARWVGGFMGKKSGLAGTKRKRR